MWVFRNDAFVSIVQDRHNPDYVWVRGRVVGDIERFFEGTLTADQLGVKVTPEADYLCRAVVDRGYVKEALVAAVDAVDYANFKGSIPDTVAGDKRHTAYMAVWTAMMAFQRRLRPKSGYWISPARERGKKKGAS